MVTYAKSCGCIALRYGVLFIAAVDIILCCLSLGLSTRDLQKSEKLEINNAANSTTSGKKIEHSLNTTAIVNIVVQVLGFIIALSLLAVALINTAKYRKILLVWIGYTAAAATVLIVILIIQITTGAIDFIEIIITVVFVTYQLVCIWFVISYYKLLEPIECSGYGIADPEDQPPL